MKNKVIIGELKDRLSRNFGKNIDHVELFGSQVKGTAKKDSDYDVMIVLKNDYDWDYKDKIGHVCDKIERKYNIWIQTHFVSLNQLYNGREGKEPLFFNVLKKKYDLMITDKDREALIKYRIEHAKKIIDEVKILIDNDLRIFAVNRIYYCMYYMLSALAIKHKVKTVKHQPLLDWFKKNFTEKKLIEYKYFTIIDDAFKNRCEGDYKPFVTFTKKKVLEMFKKMKDFINALEQFILK